MSRTVVAPVISMNSLPNSKSTPLYPLYSTCLSYVCVRVMCICLFVHVPVSVCDCRNASVPRTCVYMYVTNLHALVFCLAGVERGRQNTRLTTIIISFVCVLVCEYVFMCAGMCLCVHISNCASVSLTQARCRSPLYASSLPP